MSHRWLAVFLGLLLLFGACGRGSGTVVDDLARVSDVELGTPILVFVYTDG